MKQLKNTLYLMEHPSQGQYRRDRTRTLIQLGGLMDKAGILDVFNIHLGQDLQKDPQHKEAALQLAGALSLFKTWMEHESLSHSLLSEKGKAVLGA